MDNNSDLFQQVKEYLLSRAPVPGERIETEQSLSVRFGVTRYKIRQVLNTLSQMGLIERSPRRGSSFRDFDPSSLSAHIKFQFEVAGFDIADYTEARMLVECAILPLVVRRVTPRLIAQLDRNILDMEACADTPHIADDYDRDFHLLLLEACGNKVLQAFSGVLVTLFKNARYRERFRNRDYILYTIATEHRAVVAAIKSGNEALAVERLEDHLLMRRRPGGQQGEAEAK